MDLQIFNRVVDVTVVMQRQVPSFQAAGGCGCSAGVVLCPLFGEEGEEEGHRGGLRVMGSPADLSSAPRTCQHVDFSALTQLCIVTVDNLLSQKKDTQHAQHARHTTQHTSRTTTQQQAQQHSNTHNTATQHNTTQHNTTQHNATQRNATRRDATQRNAMRRDATRRDATASHRIATQRNATQRNATASHRIASHRIASHRIASHRIASHRIASCCCDVGSVFQVSSCGTSRVKNSVVPFQKLRSSPVCGQVSSIIISLC